MSTRETVSAARIVMQMAEPTHQMQIAWSLKIST